MSSLPKWFLVLLVVLAFTVFAAAISYKYTGDFTGLMPWSTRHQGDRR